MRRTGLKLIMITLAAVIATLVTADPAYARKKKKSSPKKPGIESVSAEKKKTEREIRNTSARLEAKKAEINRRLSELNSINAEIESNTRSIANLAVVNDSLSRLVKNAEDSVAMLDGQLEEMRRTYIKAMRQLQPYHKSTSALAFIFSADNYRTALQRVRYLREFSEWRQDKAADIEQASARLDEKKRHLASLHHKSAGMLEQANTMQSRLTANKENAGKLVASLRRDEATLRSVLEQQKKQAKALDARLDKLIAEEQARIAREEAERKKKEEARRKAEKEKERLKEKEKATKPASGKDTPTKDSKPATPKTEKPTSRPEQPALVEASSEIGRLTGSFAENKGRLPFPVAGKYRIISRFGRQPHPSLPKVQIENSGIDIETSAGAQARAVFEGKVSAIFKEDGYNSIVMVRHGKYITIYAGLDRISVKTGDRVNAGQTLGTVNRDASRGVPVLHFEIRNERAKLNPQSWLK